MRKLTPTQFYKDNWFDLVVPLMKSSPSIFVELDRLCDVWLMRLESILDPDLNEDDLRAELDLAAHEGRVRRFAIHWLKNTFGSDDLVDLSLLIAARVYPGLKWIVLEQGEHSVVTNPDRTVVFDFHHCYELSPRAALALCGDSESMSDDHVLMELNAFLEFKIDRQRQILKRARSALGANLSLAPELKSPRSH